MILLAVGSAWATTVGVLEFEAHTDRDDLRPLGAGITNMLITDLQRGDGIVLVERSAIDAVLTELDLQASDRVDPDSAAQIGALLGADLLVVGGLTVNADQVRLDARLVDVDSGRSVGAADVEGPISEFFGLERRLALQLLLAAGATVSSKDMKYLQQGPEASMAELISLGAGGDAEELEPVPLTPAGRFAVVGILAGGGLLAGSWALNRADRSSSTAQFASLRAANILGGIGVVGGGVVFTIDRLGAPKRRGAP